MLCKSYSSVIQKMNDFAYLEFKTKNKQNIAYTLKITEKNKELKIFLPSDKEYYELNRYLFVHEAGHIIFNHVFNTKEKETLIRSRLEKVYEKHIDLFNGKQEFFNSFYGYVFNIAQDFEVNSKLYTKDEFDYLNQLVTEYTGTFSEGMWPEKYGFPIGKNWRFYLNLIIEDLPNFVKNMKNEFGDSDNDSNSGNDGLSEDEMEKIAKEVGKMSEEELMNLDDTKSALNGGNYDSEFIKINADYEVKDISQIIKIIQKQLFNADTELKHDLLYKSNRLCESVIRPKDIEIECEKESNFYVLLDVSGSIPAKFVTDVILSFRKFSKNFSKKSRIIQWNSSLANDSIITDDVPICAGGNTFIASGISYIDSHYKTNDSILFLISDMDDYLESWIAALKNSSFKKKVLISVKEENLVNFYSVNPSNRNVFDQSFVTSFNC